MLSCWALLSSDVNVKYIPVPEVPLHWLKQARYKKANMEISDLTNQEVRKTLREDSTHLFHARSKVNWYYPSPVTGVTLLKPGNLNWEQLHRETVNNSNSFQAHKAISSRLTAQALC